MDFSQLSVTDFLDRLGGPSLGPGSLAAAALSAAMGVGLLEKALQHPAASVAPPVAASEAEIMRLLRRKLGELAATDALVAIGDDEAGRAARLSAYRAARKLIDLVLQALTLLQKALDLGDTRHLAEVETGWRLLAAALESGIAASEEHLKHLDRGFSDSEGLALGRQAQQGRELAGRASGALSWRRGKA